ncbi:MAG: aminopeptidase N [Actinomycetales bacterium]|nr:aminopeptidase N [Actinomycetales bacterium]
MSSLGRVEAQRRAQLLQVQRYDIALDLDLGPEHFASVTSVTFTVADIAGRADAAGGDELWIDVAPAGGVAGLHEVTLNGIPLAAESWAEGRLPLPADALRADNELRVRATMAYRRDGSGLHRAVDPADGEAYLYQQSFLDAAPSVFPCFDQPDLKARYAVHVRTPRPWVVVGNGAATELTPGEWELALTQPISTYLVAICAGPYVSICSEHDGIPLGLHARASLAKELARWAPQIFEVTTAALDAYHGLFGIRYPFGEYHQVFVPDFNAIAMENPGCVTLRDALLFRGAATPADVLRRSRTVVHEMAHMWFGDLVTMQWWDDLWLNESFAEYLAHRVLTGATEFADAWVDFGILRKPWGYAGERAPTTHPVAGGAAANAQDALADFDGISYAKGACAIRQLIAYAGDAGFIAGVSAYLREHAFGNGTFDEFLAAVSAACGRDLRPWAQAWLLTAGRDTLTVAVDPDGLASVVRTPPTAYPAARPHVLDVGVYAVQPTGAVSADVARVVVEANLTPAPGLSMPARDRVVLSNCSDLTWAALDLDPESLRLLPEVLGRLADPLARSVAWQALTDGTARGYIDPRVAIAAFEQGWPQETHPALAQVVADDLVALVRRFVPESGARAQFERLAATGQAVLARADGAQLFDGQAVVAALLVARSSTDAELLRGWLETPPAPLVGDVDFRWAVVTSLAASGALSQGELEAHAAADRSTSGRLAYLFARAAMPDPAAKRWAFDQLVSPSAGLTNHEHLELARGLWRAPDPALVREYVGPFLAALPGMFEWVGADAVNHLLRFGFPAVVEPATVERVDEALADPRLPTALQRAYVERAWPLREAVASRQRWWPAACG